MEITNHKTKHKSVLNFKPSGWFGKDLHKLEGFIYDKEWVQKVNLVNNMSSMFAVCLSQNLQIFS